MKSVAMTSAPATLDTERSRESSNTEGWLGWDWAAAFFLFFASAGVVLWQNSRLGILWDLSYVLENSYRISLGDFPYRDFPFPFAPLTFLIQSLLIRLTGRVFFHHVLYCAVVGGLGTVLTWRIVKHLVHGAIASVRLVAFLLALPLSVVGIYGVFPHPFYDPDCTFTILLCVFLLQQSERKDFPSVRAFVTGVVLVVPLFVKQNTGLAFLATAGLAITILMLLRAWRRQRASGYAWLIAGIAVGLALASFVIYFTVGVRNYERWTVLFAAARRFPAPAGVLASYWTPLLPFWVAAFAAGALLLWRSRHSHKWWRRLLSVSLLSLPFVWPLLYLLIESDPSDRADSLLALWPLLLIVSFACALLNIGRGSGVTRILPFILIATVQGAFLAQQLWGSTYAIWPLLILLLAGVLAALAKLSSSRHSTEIVSLACVASLSLLVSGGYYVASHERLDYADVSRGQLARPTLPALAGLSVRGPWIPQFEELVRFSDREIPSGQELLMIPGEDLFYYATGRRPRFPILLFDHTVNPFTPNEIVELARRRNVCWLVVKKNLQLKDDPVEDRSRLLDLLRADFAPVRHLANYDVYRRSSYGACPDVPPTAAR
jgi:hypothetical protein